MTNDNGQIATEYRCQICGKYLPFQTWLGLCSGCEDDVYARNGLRRHN